LYLRVQNDIEKWCLPADSEADPENNIVYVKDHTGPVILQCPYPLQTDSIYTHLIMLIHALLNQLLNSPKSKDGLFHLIVSGVNVLW